MAHTSSRMLELLSLLQAPHYWLGAGLSKLLDVSPRTLRRDVERLRGLGYPVESVPGVDGGYQMASGSALPPMVFNDAEAVALAVGLRNVAHNPDPATAEASTRALAKLSAMLPAAVRTRVDQLAEVTAEPFAGRSDEQPSTDVIGTVAQACADSVRLRFGYRARAADRDEPPAERYVEPYRLLTRGRRWYLVAFDLDRGDWRTFRVDRVSDPAPARNTFTPRPPPADDLNRYLAERISELRPRVTAEVEVDLPPDEIAARLGAWVTTTPVTPTRTRVEMTVEHYDWALFAVARLDAPFTPLTSALRDHLADRTSRLTAALAR
jgi:predicted DNA-binding transcriptional regulator YafY